MKPDAEKKIRDAIRQTIKERGRLGAALLWAEAMREVGEKVPGWSRDWKIKMDEYGSIRIEPVKEK